MKQIICLIVFSLCLSGCSSHYQLSTNVDKKNFQQYFAAGTVKIYKSEQDMPALRQFIEIVEGQDCQAKKHHAVPDKINARTQARQQAFDKKANAIIFTGCAEFSSKELAKLSQSSEAKQCHALIICYGKAFAVKPNEKTE